MSPTRFVAIVLIVTMLSIGVAQPPAAHALDDTEPALVVAGAAIAAYFVIVLIATSAIFHKSPLSLAPMSELPIKPERQPGRLRMGERCSQLSDSPATVCW